MSAIRSLEPSNPNVGLQPPFDNTRPAVPHATTIADHAAPCARGRAAVAAPANAGTTALLAATAPGGPALTPGIRTRRDSAPTRQTSMEISEVSEEGSHGAARAARIALSPLGIPAAVVGLTIFCVGFTAVAVTAPVLPYEVLDRFDAQAFWEVSMAPAGWLLDPVVSP